MAPAHLFYLQRVEVQLSTLRGRLETGEEDARQMTKPTDGGVSRVAGMTEQESTAIIVRPQDGATIGPVLPLVSPEAMTEAMRSYEALKKAVLGENDEQEITVKGKKRKFIKRSGWRRLSIAFGVSTTILDRKITSGPEGRTLSAEFTVRATAPNGRYADGWGACSAWEERFQDERGRLKMEHDIPATAETRAENRASSNLFGYGEMSAEEMEDSPGVAKPTCPNCGKFVRESTFNPGEWFCWTKQGGCGWKGTTPVLADSGEIAFDKASAESVAALQAEQVNRQAAGATTPPAPSQEAQGSDLRQSGGLDSPPSTAIQEPAAAVTSAPPGTAPTRSGPRAKRGNVVTAPIPSQQSAPRGSQAADFAATDRYTDLTAEHTLDEPLDGQKQYLDGLRQQAREAAAVIRHLQVKRENLLKTEQIKLGTATAQNLPVLTPNLEADDSLRQFVEKRFPGRKLVDLGEAELDGSDDAPGILRALQSIIDALHQKGFKE